MYRRILLTSVAGAAMLAGTNSAEAYFLPPWAQGEVSVSLGGGGSWSWEPDLDLGRAQNDAADSAFSIGVDPEGYLLYGNLNFRLNEFSRVGISGSFSTLRSEVDKATVDASGDMFHIDGSNFLTFDSIEGLDNDVDIDRHEFGLNYTIDLDWGALMDGEFKPATVRGDSMRMEAGDSAFSGVVGLNYKGFTYDQRLRNTFNNGTTFHRLDTELDGSAAELMLGGYYSHLFTNSVGGFFGVHVKQSVTWTDLDADQQLGANRFRVSDEATSYGISGGVGAGLTVGFTDNAIFELKSTYDVGNDGMTLQDPRRLGEQIEPDTGTRSEWKVQAQFIYKF